jgi:hypothetical protein
VGTHKNVYSSVQGDGGGDGKAFTTGGADVAAGDALVVAVGSSSNADTISVPGTGTWAEITLPDNVVTSSGGLIRVYKCQNPANSTTYTFTLSGGRRSLIAGLASGLDATNCVDVASSLESAAGANHAPPSVTPNASSELVYDFAFHRQFSPDTANWTVPASGLTWTERADVQGADGNNNIRLALGTAVAGSSGVAISTTAWTTSDTLEEAMIARIVLKDAAGGGASGSATTTDHVSTQATGLRGGIGTAPEVSHVTTTATGAKGGKGTASSSAHVSSIATGQRGGAGSATTAAHPNTLATTAAIHGGPALSSTHATTTTTGRKNAIATAATSAHPLTAATGQRRGLGTATTTGHPHTVGTGRRGGLGTARTQAHPTTTATTAAADTTPRASVGVDSTSSTFGTVDTRTTSTGRIDATAAATGAVG